MLSTFLLLAASGTQAPGDSLPVFRIDTISIVPHGALEGSVAHTPAESLGYAAADWIRDEVLHSRTKPSTIRDRLRFSEGDPLDSARLSESERLLRQERFLAESRLATRQLPDGRTLLEAETWDRWSTSIPVSFIRTGGELTWSLGVRESNLLGTGQDIGGYYQSAPRRDTWIGNYQNTAFLGPDGLLKLSYSDFTDGHNFVGTVGCPARSVHQSWAWQADLQDMEYDRQILATPSAAAWLTDRYGATWDGEDSWIAQAPRSAWRWARFSGSRLWGRETRLQASGLVESELDSSGQPRSAFGFQPDRRNDLVADPVVRYWLRRPPQRDDRRVGLALTLQRIDWVRLRNFNQLKWTEDIPLGWSLGAQYLRNVLSRGEVRDDGYFVVQGAWTGMAEEFYGSVSGTWKEYVHGSDLAQGSVLAKSEGRWMPVRNLQLLANGVSESILGVPAPVSEVSLGEDNGLPGFPARALSGRGRFLSTTEIRWTPPLEALTLAPALAVFGGTGRVSDDASPFGAGPWHTGVGVGLRLGLTRSPQGVVNHLSISLPVGDDYHRGWLLSVGAKQSL